ncbi:MAG: hypothetical protein ACR2M8_06180 [Pyrinomonadaceae bacterium]|nr:hypothetical protein [Blastocatellia bacterium]
MFVRTKLKVRMTTDQPKNNRQYPPRSLAAFAAGLKRWYDLADGKITTEKEDYEADRL